MAIEYKTGLDRIIQAATKTGVVNPGDNIDTQVEKIARFILGEKIKEEEKAVEPEVRDDFEPFGDEDEDD